MANDTSLGQQQPRSGIIKHETYPLLRVAWVNRQIRTTGLKYPQQICRHQQRWFGNQRDYTSGSDSSIYYQFSNFIRFLIKPGVGDMLPLKTDGNAIRSLLHLLFKQSYKGCVNRPSGYGGVKVIMNPPQFGRCQKR